MAPSPTERDQLFKDFARALFTGDIDALYEVVTPDFLWSFHDGLDLTKSLDGPAAIREHLAEQKVLFAVQRFHEVSLSSCRGNQLHDIPRKRDLAGNRRTAGAARHREL